MNLTFRLHLTYTQHRFAALFDSNIYACTVDQYCRRRRRRSIGYVVKQTHYVNRPLQVSQLG